MFRLAAALFLAFTTAVYAAGDRFHVGGWKGEAFYSESGEFVHCVMGASYEGGDALLFALTSSGQLRLGLDNAKWRVTPGEAYTVSLEVDGKPLGEYRARGFSATGVMAVLPYTKRTMTLLEHGSVLIVIAGERRFQYKLTNTVVALPRLELCLKDSVAGSRS